MVIKQATYRAFLLFCVFFLTGSDCFAQAEFPRAIRTYIKINENAPQVKKSRISKSTEILVLPGSEDTMKVTYYDPDGYILSETSLVDTSSGKKGEFITRKYYFVYNNYKLLTEKIDSTSANTKKYYLKYDEFYNVTEEQLFVQNKQVQKYEYEYDDLSRLTEAEMRDILNDCKVMETYDYDSYNNLVRVTVRNKCIPGEDKPIETKYNYTYDKEYRILEKKTIATSGEYKTETFTYTAEGKPETSYEITGKDTYITRKYIYENNTVRIKKTETIGELTSSSDILIKYDKNGNRILEEYYDPAGKVLYSYKFVYNYY